MSNPYPTSVGARFGSTPVLPCPGPDDWAQNNLQDYLSYFSGTSGRRYYDVCQGAIHFFFLDTSPLEPDGITSSGAQAEWLRAKMLLSPAPWKVVVLHDSPHSTTNPNPAVDWPFKDWGAIMVLSAGGLNYERFNVNGIAYINNGLGGNGIVAPNLPATDPTWVFSYSSNYGTGIITASETSINYTFYDVNGNQIDTVGFFK